MAAIGVSDVKLLEQFRYTFWSIKMALHNIKRSSIVFVLAAAAFLVGGCGGSGGSTNTEFSGLILQTTEVSTPAVSAPVTSGDDNSSTTTMTFSSRDIQITEKDKKDFADNLAVGNSVESSARYKGAPKTVLWFMAPQSIIVWHISTDENPGILEVTKVDQPRGPNAKIVSKEYFELSDSTNKFAGDWLAAHSH